LIKATERPDFELAPISRNAPPKRQRQMLGQLREHQLALVHLPSPRRIAAQGRRAGVEVQIETKQNVHLFTPPQELTGLSGLIN
jgi:hypothetical protein